MRVGRGAACTARPMLGSHRTAAMPHGVCHLGKACSHSVCGDASTWITMARACMHPQADVTPAHVCMCARVCARCSRCLRLSPCTSTCQARGGSCASSMRAGGIHRGSGELTTSKQAAAGRAWGTLPSSAFASLERHAATRIAILNQHCALLLATRYGTMADWEMNVH